MYGGTTTQTKNTNSAPVHKYAIGWANQSGYLFPFLSLRSQRKTKMGAESEGGRRRGVKALNIPETPGAHVGGFWKTGLWNRREGWDWLVGLYVSSFNQENLRACVRVWGGSIAYVASTFVTKYLFYPSLSPSASLSCLAYILTDSGWALLTRNFFFFGIVRCTPSVVRGNTFLGWGRF